MIIRQTLMRSQRFYFLSCILFWSFSPDVATHATQFNLTRRIYKRRSHSGVVSKPQQLSGRCCFYNTLSFFFFQQKKVFYRLTGDEWSHKVTRRSLSRNVFIYYISQKCPERHCKLWILSEITRERIFFFRLKCGPVDIISLSGDWTTFFFFFFYLLLI